MMREIYMVLILLYCIICLGPMQDDLEMFKVQYPYTANSKTDIHLKVGDAITQVEEVGNGWSLGYNISSGKTGTFPTEFIKKEESIRKRISRLSTVKRRSNHIPLETVTVKVKSSIELPIPEGKAIIPTDVLQKRLSRAPYNDKRIKNSTESTTNRKKISGLFNGNNNTLKHRVLKGMLGFLFACLACGVLFVLLHFSYEYPLKLSLWITLGCFVPILLGMILSKHFRCVMLLIVPGLFTGKGQAIFLSMIFVQLLAGPAVNIAYNAEQATESMACAQELIYKQTEILKNQLEAPIRRIEKTIWNGLQKVKNVADKINDFIEPVFGVINSFTSGLDSARNALSKAARQCSIKIREAQGSCENGIRDLRQRCRRDVEKHDPGKHIEKGVNKVKDWGEKTVGKIGNFFRSLGKKRKRRAVTEEEKRLIEKVKSLIDHTFVTLAPESNMRKKPSIGNNLDGNANNDAKFFYPGNPNTPETTTTRTGNPKETPIMTIKLEGKTAKGSKFFYRGKPDTPGPMTTGSEGIMRENPAKLKGETSQGSKYSEKDTRIALFKMHGKHGKQRHALQRYKRAFCTFCWTCDILKLDAICNVVKIGEYVGCTPMRYGSEVIKSVNNKIKETVDNVKSYFYFDFDGKIDGNAKANSSKTAAQIVSEVKEDIQAKIDGIRKVSDIITNVLTFTLLLLFIQSALYLKKFLSKDSFENFYISRSFKDFNQKLEENGEESVLPLKRKEMTKYVDTRSPWLAHSELQTAKKGFAKVVIHFIIAVVIIFFDYILHFVLTLIDRYGNLNINIGGNTYLEVSVDGTGFIAAFLRAFLSTVDLDNDFGVQFNLSTCIPKPRQPDEKHIYTFGILYGCAFIFLFIRAYSLRLRRKIASWFFPERDEARHRYLCEKIRQKRKAFSGWMRQHIMSRDKQIKLENQMSLRSWLQYNHPKIARYICCCLPYRKNCLNCDLTYDKFQRFHKCDNCLSSYCELCFQKELKSKCVICDSWDKTAKRNTDIFK